jgi:hypothetical protein
VLYKIVLCLQASNVFSNFQGDILLGAYTIGRGYSANPTHQTPVLHWILGINKTDLAVRKSTMLS